MPHPMWTEVVQAIASIAGVLTTIIGFTFLSSQLRQVERTIRSEANSNLCAQSIEILKAISDCPEAYACFYDNVELPTDHDARVRVLCVCEMVVNYLDHVCMQKDNLTFPVWERWRTFVCDTVNGSRVVQEHLRTYAKWYSPELHSLVGRYVKQP